MEVQRFVHHRGYHEFLLKKDSKVDYQSKQWMKNIKLIKEIIQLVAIFIN